MIKKILGESQNIVMKRFSINPKNSNTFKRVIEDSSLEAPDVQ